MSIYRLIDAEKTVYPVCMLCRVLGVSRSGYYDYKDRPPSQREQQDEALTTKIHEIHQRSRGTYGSPRIHAELRSIGIRCGRKRVARLMRKTGIRGCLRGSRKQITRRSKHAVPAVDRVSRDFSATAPDKLWAADITYVATEEGFLYLAFVLDAYSRRLVGWAMESHLRTELVVDALGMAIWRRDPAPGLIHHSDQGVQGGFNWSKQHVLVVVSLAVLGKLRPAFCSPRSSSDGSSGSPLQRLVLRVRILRDRCRAGSTA